MSEPAYRRPDKVLVYLYRRGTLSASAQGVAYLLLRRQPKTTTAGKIWQTVVGGVRWHEKRVQAASREVFEETGLTMLRGITAIGYAFAFPIRLRKNQSSWYPPGVTTVNNTVFAAEVVSPRPIRLSPEHIDYGWFPYPEAMAKIYWPEEKEALSRLHPMLQPSVTLHA
jgi:8-oxo-dGTP pyrophosphatase MutT (NUDIX family)